MIQQMVKEASSVGIVPIYSGLQLEQSLVIRPFADMNPVVSLGIVYKNKDFLGKASLLLIDTIRAVHFP